MKTVILSILVSALLLCIASCRFKNDPGDTGMPDPDFIQIQKSIKKVNIAVGADDVITLHKPKNAYFSIAPTVALNRNKSVHIKANDASWQADVYHAINEPFVEYYYKGVVNDFEYFYQEVTDLGITHFNKPVKYIKSTYKNPKEEAVYEIHIVGFEDAESDGIIGFKIYSPEKELSATYLRGMFSELFFQER